MGETIAFAVHLQDVDVVGDAVKQRAGQALGSECFGPFVKRQVAGDQGGPALVALQDQLEKQLRAHMVQGSNFNVLYLCGGDRNQLGASKNLAKSVVI